MINTPAQHALREMRRTFSMPTTQVVLVAVAVFLGISGPFGTSQSLSFGPRLAYWVVAVPITFAVGVLSSAYVSEIRRSATSRWSTRILVASATAIAVSITVVGLNWLAFGISPEDRIFSLPLLAPIMATAALVAFVLHYLSEQSEEITAPNARAPALLDRLDLDKRGKLISLSVQDHYVEVTTSAGTSLILMRLSDAMRETGDVEGLQVHRSHWVARAHVVAAKRDGDKAQLTLSDGRVILASRSHIKALKDTGILPR